MELANKLLSFVSLYDLHESKSLKKCMLSAHLHVTRDCRIKLLKHFGFSINDDTIFIPIDPKFWLGSAKIPVKGEGLADKGSENDDRCFSWFNCVNCPKVMRIRNVKQHEPSELITKGVCCIVAN